MGTLAVRRRVKPVEAEPLKPPMIPRDEQETVIRQILLDKKHLCRAEGGAGKTLVATEAVLRSGAAVTLVVCPLNTFTSWEKTFLRQSRGEVQPRFIDKRVAGQRALEDCMSGVPGVYLIGWERFRRFSWFKSKVNFVIWDEVHRGQNRKSSTHTAMTTCRRAEYALAMSATPSGNKIEGLFAILKSLWWSDYPSFWNWATEFCTVVEDPYASTTLDNGHKVEGRKVLGERNPGAIWKSLASASFFKAPYQDEPLVYSVEVDLLPAQRKLYDRFERDAVVWLKEHPLATDLPIVQRVRLRDISLAVPSIRKVWKLVKDDELDTVDGEVRIRDDGRAEALVDEVYYEDDAKSTKADAIVELLSDLHAGGPVPVLIYTHSRRFATMLTKQLQAKGFNALRFVGNMPPFERAWKRDNFGIEFDVMVCTIGAIGEGTDGLQERCNIEVWASLEDNRLLNKQAIWRLSRLGQTKTVRRYLILAKDTLEVRQLGRIEADQAALDESFETEEDNA